MTVTRRRRQEQRQKEAKIQADIARTLKWDENDCDKIKEKADRTVEFVCSRAGDARECSVVRKNRNGLVSWCKLNIRRCLGRKRTFMEQARRAGNASYNLGAVRGYLKGVMGGEWEAKCTH